MMSTNGEFPIKLNIYKNMDDLDKQKGCNVDHLVNEKQKDFVWIIKLNEVFVYNFGSKVDEYLKRKLGP